MRQDLQGQKARTSEHLVPDPSLILLLHDKCKGIAEETCTSTTKNNSGRLVTTSFLYLAENSDASDTFEGIVEFWLLNQQVKFETKDVGEALTKLVSDGLIEEPDSRTSSRINRTKEQAIEQC
jgi:hypothetical protein